MCDTYDCFSQPPAASDDQNRVRRRKGAGDGEGSREPQAPREIRFPIPYKTPFTKPVICTLIKELIKSLLFMRAQIPQTVDELQENADRIRVQLQSQKRR
jgi:hypothetical protein